MDSHITFYTFVTMTVLHFRLQTKFSYSLFKYKCEFSDPKLNNSFESWCCQLLTIPINSLFAKNHVSLDKIFCVVMYTLLPNFFIEYDVWATFQLVSEQNYYHKYVEMLHNFHPKIPGIFEEIIQMSILTFHCRKLINMFLLNTPNWVSDL